MLIFAHRGASGYAPENTLKAMSLAVDMGAQAIELDIHNVEGELVVFHDRRLEAKTKGHGLIAEQSLESLNDIQIDGEPIATLWQVLSLLAAKVVVNIEFKGLNVVEPFIALYPKIINQLGYQAEQLLISSFDQPVLKRFKLAFPNALIAPLLHGIPIDYAAIGSQLDAWSIHLDINYINQQLVDDAKSRDLKVFVFTVDYPDDLQRVKQMGVDGIFTNYPDRALALLTE